MTAAPVPHDTIRYQPIALVDLLDRVLGTGVVISGEVLLSIAEVDLVTISLRALISSVRADSAPPHSTEERPW